MANRFRAAPALPLLAGALLATAASAAGPRIREVQVRFEKGESRASLKGELLGDEVVDYALRASAGQGMRVSLDASHLAACFNVLPPGSEEALFIGSTSGNRFEGTLPADGVYRVRVYLMRSAARRNEKATYALEIGVTSKAGGALEARAADRPPGRYDASGDVRCAAGGAALDRWCAFRVVRDLPRHAADVWIARPGTASAPIWRFLRFEGGAFRTEGPGAIEARRQDDDWEVRVGATEAYLVPDALLHGG